MSAGTLMEKKTSLTSSQVVYLTLSQAAKSIPSHKIDGHVHTASVTRWVLRGVLDGNGQRVFLQAVRSPGGWLTTNEWVSDFLEALAQGRTEKTETPPRTIGQRARAAEAASRELDRFGV